MTSLITFITTNYINRLDPALLRPGRVDYKLEIGYATKNQLKSMINDLNPSEANNFNSFWKQVKNKKITMAAFQNFLFYCFQNKKSIITEIKFLLDLLDNTNNYSTMFV